MIEFVLKNPRHRLYADGTITRRALNSKVIAPKNEIWIATKCSRNYVGFMKRGLCVKGIEKEVC